MTLFDWLDRRHARKMEARRPVVRSQPDPEHTRDKLALFILAGLVVVVLGLTVIGAYWMHGVPDKGDVLLGTISTGLILFLRDLVTAVRTSWEEVTRGKTVDKLAEAQPALDPDHAQKVIVDNDPDNPVPTHDEGKKS